MHQKLAVILQQFNDGKIIFIVLSLGSGVCDVLRIKAVAVDVLHMWSILQTLYNSKLRL